MSCFGEGAACEQQQHEPAKRRNLGRLDLQTRSQGKPTPHHDQVQANLREVGEAVCHGGAAELHQTDDGREEQQKPQPACEWEPLAREAERHYGKHKEQQRSRPNPDPGNPADYLGIVDGQPEGIEDVAEIAGIAQQSVLDAAEQRIALKAGQRFKLAFRNKGECRHGAGNSEQGQLFQQQTKEIASLQPIERPPVQHEQQQGEGNDRGLSTSKAALSARATSR